MSCVKVNLKFSSTFESKLNHTVDLFISCYEVITDVGLVHILAAAKPVLLV